MSCSVFVFAEGYIRQLGLVLCSSLCAPMHSQSTAARCTAYRAGNSVVCGGLHVRFLSFCSYGDDLRVLQQLSAVLHVTGVGTQHVV
jgi:hypothetical protein